MIQRQGRRLTLALAAAVAAALVVAAVAIGASSDAPKLVKPGVGKNARMGKIRLVVKDTSSDARKFGGVFATINHRRQLNKFHQLKNCSKVTNGCDFVQLRRWAHHPGLWTYTAKYKFNGYWATTPGRYYWQADHVGEGPGGHVTSAIRSFRVVR
jgi:hypothetical protein